MLHEYPISSFPELKGRGLFESVTAGFYLQNKLSEIDTKRLTAPEQMVWYVDKHAHEDSCLSRF